MTAIDLAPPRDVLTQTREIFTQIAPVAHHEKTTSVAPRMQPSLERRRLWEGRYTRRLWWTDAAIVLVASVAPVAIEWLLPSASPAGIVDTLQGAVIVAVTWLAFLTVLRTRSSDAFGSGSTEYKRVAHATGFTFGLLAIAAVAFQTTDARLELFIALPAGLFALLVARWSWRRWLVRQRNFGRYASRAIIAGNAADVEYVIRTLDVAGTRGYTVLGAATPDGAGTTITVGTRTYPVFGTLDSVALRAREMEADTIIVASRPENDPEYIKRLSWQLEGTASELILSSRLADVAGPRISLRPLDGMPLIHVKIPRFEGGSHLLKRAMDVVVAALALIPIAVAYPFIALAIKLDDRGPVFFRQIRIGRDGREFGILKFRTMSTDAEARLGGLKGNNEGSGLLFKLKDDPRITRVGAILRKFSLDELPQFANVLLGDMSVVGPRPPLPSEVQKYDGKVNRRLYIKPGITGLWQVSGRSDLSWDESVRLDLRYVENWSIMSDLMIMWRTAQAMVRPSGAY